MSGWRRAPIGSRGTHGYNSTHPHAQDGETLRDRRTRDRVRVLGREPPADVEVLPEARHPRLRRHGPAPAREMDERRQAAQHRETREAGRLLSAADDAFAGVAD